MRITTPQLKQIIFEEYLKEEGITLDEDKSQELLDYIKGTGPKPDWYDQKTTAPTPPPPTVPGSDPNETIPIDIPSDEAPESEYKGFQNDSGPDVESRLADLIQGMEPETVAKLFQSVFEKIPGVELSSPDDEDSPEEEPPETLYVHGAEGRAKAGFELEELKAFIREVLAEGHYHDMGGEDEMYNALDPHGLDKMSDAQIVDQAWKDGLEEIIVLDGEGDLANRKEILAAMKDVDPPEAPLDVSSRSWEEKAALMADR